MAKITFHGHACFHIDAKDGTRIVIDPFLTGNPLADVKPNDLGAVHYILLTHGHGDHLGDTIAIAKRTGATVISTFEIVSFLQEKGVSKIHPLHIGGGYNFPFGRVKMTPALHGGMIDGDTGKYTTVPGGFLVHVDGKAIYHAGDTALIADMQLLAGQVDTALLPIGDNFTMGPEDAVRAVEMIQPKVVIPMHYNTFDVIRQDPQAFARRVGSQAKVVILKPGESYEA
ncbi:MAG: metal-dependent hydrolase [Gemmatimonadetes bacterium]|nr:metal-dependent hydrolase [Gemmatimonadota bacterium]